jgi:hypothetical protein
VAIVAPAADTTVDAPATITLVADASDPDDGISRVEFVANDVIVGEANAESSFTWRDVPAGEYAVRAVATDHHGAASTSGVVNVVVRTPDPGPPPPNEPPTVSITGVSAGQVLTSSTFTIGADAADSDGTIASVEFFSNGTLIGESTTAPYAITLTGMAEGEYVLAARATDSAGAQTTSASVDVRVDLNAPPEVSLLTPTAGATFTAPATIAIVAVATDDTAVASVELFAGSTLIGVATSAPYSATWVDAAPGSYSLTARAIDSDGAITTSAPVMITVDAPPPPAPLPVPGPIEEIVLHAAAQAEITGGWTVMTDASAAGGARLQNPNLNAPKLTTPILDPPKSFELTFDADAGRAYRIWIRGKALKDSYNNDSVYIQFDGSVDAAGRPIWRTGTTSATSIVLEDCGGCGVKGWGWADNGYGLNVFGPLVYFAQGGPQRMRIQIREDGFGIDQVVLSAVAYKTTPPGSFKNDTTILPRTP